MRAAFFADVQPTALRALNYAPELVSIRRAAARKRSVALKDMLARLGAAYGTVFVRHDCEPTHGVGLLDQSSMFAAEPVPRFIRGTALPQLEAQRIHRWQVLLAGAGQAAEGNLFGAALLADRRLAGHIVGPDAMVLDFKEPGSDRALFSYAFMQSRAGLRSIRSASYGSSIPRIRKDLLAELPIPLGTDEQMARTAAIVRKTVDQREAYAEHIRTARALLDRIPGFSEAREMCEKRRARCVNWDGSLTTFTAWTYASAGDALSFLSKKWSGRLGDIIEPGGIFNGHRFARTSCEPPHGIDLLSQRDVFLIRPSPRRVAHPGFADRLIFAQPYTLLAGGAGTLGEGELFGRVEIAGPDWAALGLSQHLLRILPRRENAAVAYAFLSSIVGFQLLRSTAVGTKVLSLRPDLLRALPFPDVPRDLAADFESHVVAALTSRAAATAAEQEAIRIIEEEVLPAWLA